MLVFYFVAVFAVAVGTVMAITPRGLSGNTLGLVFCICVAVALGLNTRARRHRDAYLDDLKQRGICWVCKGSGRVATVHVGEQDRCYACKGTGRY